MATFGDLSGILGYDIMSPMYQQITGQTGSDPFSMDLGEGNNWLLGAKQGQALGQFDPSVFNGIDFNWQGSGPGNSGTLSATRNGQSLGSWSQYDTPFSETLMDALMTAGAAFGGLGLAGAGPWSGLADLFGGAAGAAGEGAAAAGATGGLEAGIAADVAAETAALASAGVPEAFASQMLNIPGLSSAGAGLGATGLGAGLFDAGIASDVAAQTASLASAGVPESLATQMLNVPGLSATTGATAGAGLASAGDSATKAALYGDAGYGAGMSGNATSMYDKILGMTGSKGAANAAGSLTSYVDKLLTPAGAKSAIPSLVQMYSGMQQRNNAKRLMGQINGLGKAGGPYEQMLRKQLERRDAASGRRSQYGPREVELQAKLAELMTRNSGSLATLMGQSMGGTNQMLQGGLIGGHKLLDLFGG